MIQYRLIGSVGFVEKVGYLVERLVNTTHGINVDLTSIFHHSSRNDPLGACMYEPCEFFLLESVVVSKGAAQLALLVYRPS